MTDQINHQCEQHQSPFDCPDNLIGYSPKFDEYGLIVHDGGSSSAAIRFCPWCGARLPESRRDCWFDELRAKGIDDPWTQDIPEEYQSDAWYRNRED